MKVSDITTADLADYVRADGTNDTTVKFLAAALAAAKGYIKGHTSLTDDEMDEYEEISIAVFAIVADMYDVRSTTADTTAENKTVSAILHLHDKNFI